MRQDPRTRGEGAGRPASEGARKGACGPARDLGRGSPPPPPRPHPDRRTPQAPLLGPGASGPCVRVSARPQPRVAPAWRSPFLRAPWRRPWPRVTLAPLFPSGGAHRHPPYPRSAALGHPGASLAAFRAFLSPVVACPVPPQTNTLLLSSYFFRPTSGFSSRPHPRPAFPPLSMGLTSARSRLTRRNSGHCGRMQG